MIERKSTSNKQYNQNNIENLVESYFFIREEIFKVLIDEYTGIGDNNEEQDLLKRQTDDGDSREILIIEPPVPSCSDNRIPDDVP